MKQHSNKNAEKELDQHDTLHCDEEYREVFSHETSSFEQPTKDPKPPFGPVRTIIRGNEFSNPLQKIPEIEMQNEGYDSSECGESLSIGDIQDWFSQDQELLPRNSRRSSICQDEAFHEENFVSAIRDIACNNSSGCAFASSHDVLPEVSQVQDIDEQNNVTAIDHYDNPNSMSIGDIQDWYSQDQELIPRNSRRSSIRQDVASRRENYVRTFSSVSDITSNNSSGCDFFSASVHVLPEVSQVQDIDEHNNVTASEHYDDHLVKRIALGYDGDGWIAVLERDKLLHFLISLSAALFAANFVLFIRELRQVVETMPPSSGYLNNGRTTSFNHPTIPPIIGQDQDFIMGNIVIDETALYSSFRRKYVLPDIFGKKAFVKYPSIDIQSESVLRYSSIRSRAAVDYIVKVWDAHYLAQKQRITTDNLF